MAGLFFLQWMAAGIWMVSLSPVLDAHGLHGIRPYAYAASGLAAFVSPLIFGAMADRHAAPMKVLRGLTIAASAATLLATFSMERHWPAGVVLVFILLVALCAAPI